MTDSCSKSMDQACR